MKSSFLTTYLEQLPLGTAGSNGTRFDLESSWVLVGVPGGKQVTILAAVPPTAERTAGCMSGRASDSLVSPTVSPALCWEAREGSHGRRPAVTGQLGPVQRVAPEA